MMMAPTSDMLPEIKYWTYKDAALKWSWKDKSTKETRAAAQIVGKLKVDGFGGRMRILGFVTTITAARMWIQHLTSRLWNDRTLCLSPAKNTCSGYTADTTKKHTMLQLKRNYRLHRSAKQQVPQRGRRENRFSKDSSLGLQVWGRRKLLPARVSQEPIQVNSLIMTLKQKRTFYTCGICQTMTVLSTHKA